MLRNIPSRFLARIRRLPQKFWFRPLLLLSVSIVFLALGQMFLPRSDTFNALVKDWMAPDVARSVLTTLAGASATVMALVFSMTFVAMSTVAAQLGPRLLYDVDADPVTQWVAGLFLSAFATALIGLLQPVVAGSRSGQVVVALISALLTFTSLAALVFYIHHLARQLTTDVVLHKRAVVFRDRLNRIFERSSPADGKSSTNASSYLVRSSKDHQTTDIKASLSGYVDQISRDLLIDLAATHGLSVLVLVRPGQYILAGEPLLRARPLGLPEERHEELSSCIALAQERRFTEDVEKDLDSILEIMLRALSPGINDPYTAIAGIHQIGGALSDVVHQQRADEVAVGDGWSVEFAMTTIGALIEKICRSLRPALAGQTIVLDALADMLERLSVRADAETKKVCKTEHQRLETLAENHANVPADQHLQMKHSA